MRITGGGSGEIGAMIGHGEESVFGRRENEEGKLPGRRESD